MNETNERICSLVILGWEIAVARAMHPEISDCPVLIESSGRIRSASIEAMEDGARPGMRVRDAQRFSPTAAVLERDVAAAIEEFGTFVEAIHEVVHELEVVAPGEIAFKSDRVIRAYGDEHHLIDHLFAIAPVVPVLTLPGSGGARAGAAIGSGRFTSSIAARLAAAESPPLYGGAMSAGSRVIPKGAERDFLAPLPIEVLSEEIDAPDLVETCLLLGIKTLGDLAAMPKRTVGSRFGRVGIVAHHLACGFDDRPLLLSRIQSPLEAECELDPPVANVDQLMFAVKSLGDRLAVVMEKDITTARAIRLEATDEKGVIHTASWRNEGGVSNAAERARWHVEAWSLRCGICRIRLIPEGVEAERGEQLRLVGVDGAIGVEAELRAEKAISRLMTLSDVTEVFQVEENGGRLPCERATLKAISAEGLKSGGHALGPSLSRSRRGQKGNLPPWPGELPSPIPARIESLPIPIEASGDSAALAVEHGVGEVAPIPSIYGRQVVSAAGPFRYRLQWWNAEGGNERDIWQVSLDDGTALLISCDSSGCWAVDAVYD